MKTSDILLEIAKQDLKSSRLNYSNKLFPQSVFMFQQSVEKSSKALALLLNVITEKELLKIKHSPEEIFLKLMKTQSQKFKEYGYIAKLFPNLQKVTDLDEKEIAKYIEEIGIGVSLLKKLQKTKYQSSSEDIEYVLKEMNNLEKENIECEKELSQLQLTEEQNAKLISDLTTKLPEAFQLSKEYKKNQSIIDNKIKNNLSRIEEFTSEKTTKLIKFFGKAMLPVYFAQTAMIFLSILTMNHAIIARYPIESKNPLIIYQNKLPLVKYLPKLIDLQEKGIIAIYEYNKLLDSNTEKLNPELSP